MILGHYASAFLVRPHLKEAPFWLLLLASNLPEFLWLLLALLGIEPTLPSSILDATFQNLQVHMTYSHNLIPNLVLGVLFFLLVQWKWKNLKWSLASAFLCCLHVWSDYIVGFEHEVLGPDSMKIGLNSYYRFPYIAILLEWIFAMLCLTYFVWLEKSNGQILNRKKIVVLYLAFSIGILAWLPNSYLSIRTMLGL